MFAGYALLMFFATVLAVGYYIFLLVIKCAKKLYHKLFPEKVVLPPPPVFIVRRVYPEYEECFNSFNAAFDRAAELFITDASRINHVAIEKDGNYEGSIKFSENEKDVIYLWSWDYGTRKRKLTPEQLAAFDKD